MYLRSTLLRKITARKCVLLQKSGEHEITMLPFCQSVEVHDTFVGWASAATQNQYVSQPTNPSLNKERLSRRPSSSALHGPEKVLIRGGETYLRIKVTEAEHTQQLQETPTIRIVFDELTHMRRVMQSEPSDHALYGDRCLRGSFWARSREGCCSIISKLN